MSFVSEMISHAFAGLWDIIVSWALGSTLLALLLVGALAPTLFAGVPILRIVVKWLQPLRIDLLLAAAAVAGAMVFGAHMQNLERQRCKAQTVVVTKYITRVVKQATSPAARKQKDPYDDPNLR